MLSPPSFSMSNLLALCFRSKSSQSFFRGLTWILVYCASSDLNLSIRISIPRRSCTASTFKKTKVLSKIKILHVTNINYCFMGEDTLQLESASTKWGFYNFTIITNDTHQIITLRMTSTTISTERSLSFIFTTFADVARHASCTRWHPVSRLKCNVLPAPDLLLSPLSPTAGSRSSSHFHVGPTCKFYLLPPAPEDRGPRAT